MEKKMAREKCKLAVSWRTVENPLNTDECFHYDSSNGKCEAKDELCLYSGRVVDQGSE